MTAWQEKLLLAEEHLQQSDQQLAYLIRLHGTCSLTPHTNYYDELISSIISQQLSVKAAATIYKRFLGLFDDQLPTPEQILAQDTESLRAVGCSYAKASYIRDLASHIVDKRLDLDHIATLPNDEIIHRLVAVKGIGEWSAHMFMIFSLGRLDVLPTGDLGVKKAVQNVYELTSLPTPGEMRLIAANNKWSPYESVASWHLWRSLEND